MPDASSVNFEIDDGIEIGPDLENCSDTSSSDHSSWNPHNDMDKTIKDIRIRKLEQIISTVFHKGYKGGLAKWISDYESAFAELVELQTEDGGKSTWEDDATKKRRLFENAQNTGATPTVMEEIAKDKDFSEAAMLLRKHALIQHEETKQLANRNFHQTQHSTREMTKTQEMTEAVICKLAKVPFSLWSTMSDDVKQWLIAERLRQSNEEKKTSKSRRDHNSHAEGNTPLKNEIEPSGTQEKQPLPNQYAKTHEVQNQLDDEDEDAARLQLVDEFLEQAMTDYLEESQQAPRKMTVTRSNHGQFPDHSETVSRIMHSIALNDHEQVALSDNGSDSTVIGKVWHIISEEAFRTASLSGLYDFVLGKRLPIVSGIAACDLPNNQTVILQVDEAIYDKDLNHSIFSEFQMREAGVTVDSIAKRHGGSQTITLQQHDDRAEIPLTLSCALMYLTLRRPTTDEITQVENHSLPTFHITRGEQPWKPNTFSDTESQKFMDEVAAASATPALIHNSSYISDNYHDNPFFDCNDTPDANHLLLDANTTENDSQYFECDGSHNSDESSVPDLLNRSHASDSSDGSAPFYYDPSDACDDDNIGIPTTITFTHMVGCTDTWPDDLGINANPCTDDNHVYVDTEEDYHAMLNHVLGLDEEYLNKNFDPHIVAPHLKSRYTTSKPTRQQLAHLEKYFAFRPPDVIRKTLERTTQLAKAVVRFPLRRHLKSRFKMLRWPRINEVVATDTYFSSVKSIEGYTCSQVFYGLTSKKLHIEGMRTESQFPDAYMDFIRKNGIPHTLRRDNAKAQKSERVKEIHRDLIIADQFTEPHSPWQNPCEHNGVLYLKDHAQVLMDRTNTPPPLWFLCHQYLVDVYNVCAHPQLNWQIPDQAQGGGDYRYITYTLPLLVGACAVFESN